MKIDVTKVADLANLKLSEKEREEFSEQLNNIVEYIEKLDKIDTSNVEPTSQVTGLSNVYQEEQKENSFTQDEATSESQKKHNGLFVVEQLVDTT